MAKKKELWMAFVDLEKAFDRLPTRVLVCWGLRYLGVDDVDTCRCIRAMYED